MIMHHLCFLGSVASQDAEVGGPIEVPHTEVLRKFCRAECPIQPFQRLVEQFAEVLLAHVVASALIFPDEL